MDHSFFSIEKREDDFYDLKVGNTIIFSAGTKQDIIQIIGRLIKELEYAKQCKSLL